MPSKSSEQTTPTTPRPMSSLTDEPEADPHAEDPSAKTPTKDSFGGVSGQRALPEAAPSTTPTLGHARVDSKMDVRPESSRASPQESEKSAESQDVEMKEEGKDGSGNESADEDNSRPSKKKKGQRFFCTDFPPCTLSFTRSEHLARHIR
jgi:hypothetical protein